MQEQTERSYKITNKRTLSLPVSERKLLMAFGDLVAVNLSVLLGLYLWSFVAARQLDLAFILPQSFWFIILSILWLTLATTNDFYDLRLTADWKKTQSRLIQITIQLLVIYLLIFFFSPRDALPRLFILYYAAFSYLSIAVWRFARPFAIGYAPLRRRVAVVGVGWEAQAIIEAIKNFAEADYEVVGIIDEGQPVQRDDVVVHTEAVGSATYLTDIVAALGVHEVVLATSGKIDGPLFQSIMNLYEQGLPIITMPMLYERLTGMVPIEHAQGQWQILLPLEGRSPFDPYRLLKRTIDVLLSLIGIILFGMMLPMIALIQRLDSRGPVFYVQERIGQAGKPFKLYKLRTMIPNAEAQSGPIWAAKNDDRITRFGQFMRRSRLDELPQFYNILRGDMSLVGPRPERQYFVDMLQKSIPFYRTRLAIKPGVTGWAQVNYGYGSTTEDSLNKLKYDLYYIRHRSLFLDGLIVLRTVGKVLRLQGR